CGNEATKGAGRDGHGLGPVIMAQRPLEVEHDPTRAMILLATRAGDLLDCPRLSGSLRVRGKRSPTTTLLALTSHVPRAACCHEEANLEVLRRRAMIASCASSPLPTRICSRQTSSSPTATSSCTPATCVVRGRSR